MKRSGPIQRKARLKPTRLRPKKRSPKERERIYGTPEHQAWLRGMLCLGCGRMGSDEFPHHLHHVKNGGKGRKADACWQVPLCSWCHLDLHNNGPLTFDATHAYALCMRPLASWAETLADAWAKRCAA